MNVNEAVARILKIEEVQWVSCFPSNELIESSALLSSRDGNAEIYVMDADGSNLTNITNNSASDAEPAWSPAGGSPPP